MAGIGHEKTEQVWPTGDPESPGLTPAKRQNGYSASSSSIVSSMMAIVIKARGKGGWKRIGDSPLKSPSGRTATLQMDD
jgi:hypothetical protein